MREKHLRLVISFRTTTDAMALESLCAAEGIGGRMIPLPREISADCGLSWCADLSQRTALEELMIRADIRPGGIYEVMV